MSQIQKKPNNLDSKIKEAAVVKGICSSMLSMSLPTFKELDNMLKQFGYSIVKNETPS